MPLRSAAHWLVWLISAGVLGLALVLLFIVSAMGFHDWDEAIYAQVARDPVLDTWTTLT
jgi:hypothetical protein